MKITDIRVRIVNKDKLKASVSVTFNDCFVVHDIKLIEGNNGLFMSMPSRKTSTGEFKDVAHAINSETRQWLEKAVLDAYNQELQKAE